MTFVRRTFNGFDLSPFIYMLEFALLLQFPTRIYAPGYCKNQGEIFNRDPIFRTYTQIFIAIKSLQTSFFGFATHKCVFFFWLLPKGEKLY